MLGRQIEAWCKPGIGAGWLYPVTLREVTPHFLSVKIVGNSPDACPYRWGIITGERDRVLVPDRALAMPERRYVGADLEIAGDSEALKAKLGPRYEACRRNAIEKVKAEIAAVRAAGCGARHPTYVRAAARITALCEFWALPLDTARARLEEAYAGTLMPGEARKRKRGSTKGVWSWLARRPSA
jgi:hypothetical protein